MRSNATIFMYGLEIINELPPEVECGDLGGYCNAVGIQVDWDGVKELGGWGKEQYWVVVSNIYYFHPYLGKIPILLILFKGVETTS